MQFDHLPQMKVTNSPSEEYGEWVKRTAKLLKRPYFQIHKIFEKEEWTQEEIVRYYNNATKHNGDIPSAVYWWWQRKKRNGDK